MKILFWNLNKNINAFNLALAYAKKNNVDILTFSEFPSHCPKCDGCYSKAKKLYAKNDIAVYKKDGIEIKSPSQDEDRHTGFVVGDKFVNLFIVHFSSLIYHSSDSLRRDDAQTLIKSINDFEKSYSSRTIVVGDFNSNILDNVVFSKELLGVTYFAHSMQNESYKFNKKERPLYYSPVLNSYKDVNCNIRACGTYFYQQNCYNWLAIDNLLFNKKAYKIYKKDSFKILSSLNGCKLVNNHRIDLTYSDHLPIIFTIK